MRYVLYCATSDDVEIDLWALENPEEALRASVLDRSALPGHPRQPHEGERPHQETGRGRS